MTPVVVLTGARQTGKNTLAQHLVSGRRQDRTLDDLHVLVLARRDPEALVGGGYALRTAAERAVCFDGYVRTYLERDLQDLASLSALPDLRRLMRIACLRLGQLLNQAELGRDIAVPQPTVHGWLKLLETSYLAVRLPAYAANRTKRLIKSPKLYWNDPGGSRCTLRGRTSLRVRAWRTLSSRTSSCGARRG